MGTVIRGGHYGSYDIDDGVYLESAALLGPRGGEMSALSVRELVCEAVQHGRFADAPEVRTNCVRVFYASGFHIDIPAYRVTRSRLGVESIELASSQWRMTDPTGVTDWFKAANARSPGFGRQRQLLRMVQYAKVWAHSRSQPQGSILGGFGIMTLVVHAYRPRPGRDDLALYDTLMGVRDRLRQSTLIAHPVLKGAVIPNRGGDAPVRVLLDCLERSMRRLEGVTLAKRRADALIYWDKLFHEDFFRDRPAIVFI